MVIAPKSSIAYHCVATVGFTDCGASWCCTIDVLPSQTTVCPWTVVDHALAAGNC